MCEKLDMVTCLFFFITESATEQRADMCVCFVLLLFSSKYFIKSRAVSQVLRSLNGAHTTECVVACKKKKALFFAALAGARLSALHAL